MTGFYDQHGNWISQQWRRADKREYAEAYAAFMRGEAEEPDRPASLSYMGAQAIRLRLTAAQDAVK
jgi:hypothetical protein